MKYLLLVCLVLVSCRFNQQTSKTNAGLGLEAKKRLKSVDDSPSFIAVATWFENFSIGNVKVGKHHLSAEQYLNSLDKTQAIELKVFLKKEIDRLEKIVSNNFNLKTVVTQEADEIFEILAVLLSPADYDPTLFEKNYGITTHSLFASFIASHWKDNNSTGIIDSFSADFLGGEIAKK